MGRNLFLKMTKVGYDEVVEERCASRGMEVRVGIRIRVVIVLIEEKKGIIAIGFGDQCWDLRSLGVLIISFLS